MRPGDPATAMALARRCLSGRTVAEYSFACRDLGEVCEWALRAPSVEEIDRRFRDHARCAHAIRTVSPELEARVRAAIRPRTS
jgi:predicted small metal-binding protein